MEFVEKDTVEEAQVPSEAVAAPERAGMNMLNKKATVCGDCTVVEDVEKIYVPPVDRLLVPGDIVDIREEDDTIYIIGTKEGKVTKIRGLEVAKNLKVNITTFRAYIWGDPSNTYVPNYAISLGSGIALVFSVPDRRRGREPQVGEARVVRQSHRMHSRHQSLESPESTRPVVQRYPRDDSTGGLLSTSRRAVHCSEQASADRGAGGPRAPTHTGSWCQQN